MHERQPGSRHRASARAERGVRDLTQQRLAILAGIDQANLSRLERGRGEVTTTVVERAFAALGQQLTLGLEPLDSALDASIAAQSGLSEEARLAVPGQFSFVWKRLLDAGLDFRIDGTFAAFLHGVPIAVDAFALAMTADGAEAFAVWLGRIPSVLRWNERHRDFIDYDRDPTSARPARWGTPGGEIRARVLDELPPPVSIRLGEVTYPVLPLPEVAVGDEQVGRVLARLTEPPGQGWTAGGG